MQLKPIGELTRKRNIAVKILAVFWCFAFTRRWAWWDL